MNAHRTSGSSLLTMLLLKHGTIQVSLRQTHRSYVIIYLGYSKGSARCSDLLYPTSRPQMGHGRLFSSHGNFSLPCAAANTEPSNIALNDTEYFFQSMFNAVLCDWTPEAFLAPIRGTASGLERFWGHLIRVVAPLIAAHLLVTSIYGPHYLAGAGVFVCTVAILLMLTSHMGTRSY